jgi:Glycosyl transferase family 2
MAAGTEVSFCATNLNTEDRLEGSIGSVRALGHAMGVPFEIVVADGPSRPAARRWLARAAADDPDFHLVVHDRANRGRGRRLAFEASVGRLIVPFDTSLVYDPVYANLLGRWRERGAGRMLFSEICALPRATVLGVGGWRDLVGGEDLDLYARAIRHAGLVAFPTPLRGSQSARLGAAARQLRYVEGSRLARWRRLYVVQRDQVIGANYRLRDLMAFNTRKPPLRRVAYRLFFSAAVLGAAVQPLRPFRFDVNNYLVLREEIFRSFLEGRHAQLGWDGPGPTLLLSEDEIGYLDRSSELWRSERERLRPFVAVK